MPWLQLFADTDNTQAPILEDTLIAVGAVSVTFKEYIPHGEQEKPILEPSLGETPLWQHTRITGLFDAGVNTGEISQTLAKQLPPGIQQTLRWEQLEDKDWEREWMNNYHPIQCAENLWICPSWITPPNPNATNLLLDPGLAFGTGTHPTTFLCMQWLAEQDLQNQQVIDYGCGSGILGLACLLLGANNVVGVDIDPQALLATQENLQRNQLNPNSFPVYMPDQCPPTQADMVIANILAGPLVELAQTLIDFIKPNGKLCLSGILEQQATTVMTAYSHCIEFEPVAQQDEWVRLTGHKRSAT